MVGQAKWKMQQEEKREERTIVVEIVQVRQVVLCRIRLQIGLIYEMHPTEHTPAKLAHQHVAFPHHIHHLRESRERQRVAE